MASKRINVLVYAGNGSTVESVRHALYSLRRLLSPRYSVIPVTGDIIIKEPWTSSCALLVFPGGGDLGYCQTLNGDGNRRITQYVQRGGRYLGLCAGGYYGSKRCEFEVGNRPLEVIGDRELAFFPGVSRGCAFSGFVYHSEDGARAARLDVNKAAFDDGDDPASLRVYYNGGGVFVDAQKYRQQGIEVLASYSEPLSVVGGDGAAAVVYCKVGEGAAVLTGPHPEFAAINLDKRADGPGYPAVVDALAEDDHARIGFFKACLSKLGLEVNQEPNATPSLSKLHLSSLEPSSISSLLSCLEGIITSSDGEEYIKGEADVFRLHGLTKRPQRLVNNSPSIPLDGIGEGKSEGIASAESGIVDCHKIVKQLELHQSEYPVCRETPSFNHHAFYSNLKHYQASTKRSREFGKYLLYGEVVTSTNTMLEKNVSFLKALPTGFTATATLQIAGRGRGSNVWVSPAGSLSFSTVIRHAMSQNTTAPVVLVQYLAALSIVQGIHTYDRGYENLLVKLKWPNDIYALDPSRPKENSYIKIGGILVNSSYSTEHRGGEYLLVVGVGLNTTNALPTTSLNALLPPKLAPFTLEKLLARILTSFEDLYEQFLQHGFSTRLEAMYYSHWLHSDQIVTLEAEGGVRARIAGITRDFGLLRVEELGWEDRRTGKIWELQSDHNSFDFFKGLVRRKV